MWEEAALAEEFDAVKAGGVFRKRSGTDICLDKCLGRFDRGYVGCVTLKDASGLGRVEKQDKSDRIAREVVIPTACSGNGRRSKDGVLCFFHDRHQVTLGSSYSRELAVSSYTAQKTPDQHATPESTSKHPPCGPHQRPASRPRRAPS